MNKCEHPENKRRDYHDGAVICDECGCVIEQYGKPIENPTPLFAGGMSDKTDQETQFGKLQFAWRQPESSDSSEFAIIGRAELNCYQDRPETPNWTAHVKTGGVESYNGLFATKEEAKAFCEQALTLWLSSYFKP